MGGEHNAAGRVHPNILLAWNAGKKS